MSGVEIGHLYAPSKYGRMKPPRNPARFSLSARSGHDNLFVVSDEIDEDQRALDRVRQICDAFSGTEESLLQDRPLFHVRRRRFAIFNGESSPPRPRWAAAGRTVHFLSDPDEREALLQDSRFTRSPHHGDRGWLAVKVDPVTTDWTELAELLQSSHEQVARR